MDVLERGPLLSQLATRLREARRGTGHLVMVAGEAGIGKTVLVESFIRDFASVARVLRGVCDPVVPARPFAPLVDIGGSADSGLPEALASGDRARVYDLFLAALRAPGRPPSVVVFEDLHWADDATLDLVRIIGRRLRDLPVLFIGTYRDDDVDTDHPLRLALGDVPAHVATTINVPPLSVTAVEVLAAGSRHDPARLHRATSGNPFFVTEVLASEGDGLPTTVRDAVMARAAKLSAPAQEVLAAAAVLGYRSEEDVVQAVAGQGADAIDQCVARGVLQRADRFVVFRHDLARSALLDAMPAARRRARHRRALTVLSAAEPLDAARLVEHADGAGDRTAVLGLAPVAADRAAALGAHREAAAHYATALRYANRLDPSARAGLLRGLAHESSMCGDFGVALDAQEQAIAIWRAVGDRVHEGSGLRALSSMTYFVGAGEHALALAEQAVAILEEVPEAGHELALAYAVLAQRHLVTGDSDEAALSVGERALRLAEQLGDTEVAVHARTTIGVAMIYTSDDGGWAVLEETAQRAQAAGLEEAAARARINLLEAARDMRRFGAAERYLRKAKEVVRDYDLHDLVLRGRIADLDFDRGRWDAAVEEASSLVEESGTAAVLRVRALTLIGLCAARRGDADAWGALDAALAASSPIEVQELSPLHAARAETAWLDGDLARAGAEALTGLELARRASDRVAPWLWGDLAFWAWKAGAVAELPPDVPEPYRLHANGSCRDAAACWAAIGDPYREALALADSEDEVDLRRGLEAALRLAARPLGRRIAGNLHGLGVPNVPRGPRRSTQGNPGGLTAREIEVLALMSRQLKNAQIAEHLVVSPKTVDHHVSSILHKLGVPNRRRAVEEGVRLGLKDGEVFGAG